uniref:Putative ovule protein n=1 Tax=Solanum chacoense TaxID=4108 RepID=A0A0V0HLU0_SOLCH
MLLQYFKFRHTSSSITGLFQISFSIARIRLFLRHFNNEMKNNIFYVSEKFPTLTRSLHPPH